MSFENFEYKSSDFEIWDICTKNKKNAQKWLVKNLSMLSFQTYRVQTVRNEIQILDEMLFPHKGAIKKINNKIIWYVNL